VSKRFDGTNLLRAADAFVAEKPRVDVKDPLLLEQRNLCVMVPTRLSNNLRIAAIERRTSVRALVIEALHAAGFRE
jgi:hypothetical protein